ncbi:MAG: phospho-sugar mutase [Microbacteriaceae bacterium]|jgi:phosphomannomutase|nr:phospho-sugar mutase [Microbacteriaceae bacterium]
MASSTTSPSHPDESAARRLSTPDSPDQQLLDVARAWRDQDPDASTRAQLTAAVDATAAGDPEALSLLRGWFATRIQFGTAGLRGSMGPGSAQMNRVLVGQAALGLSRFLLSRAAPTSATPTSADSAAHANAPHVHADSADAPTLVIGYDGRHNSAVFARDTAEIARAAGVRAILAPRPIPTPVTAYALRALDADGAVMVTASHNPARDNGYKVYLGGADAGSQIIAPQDAEISACIEQVAAEEQVTALPRRDDYELLPESVIDAYVNDTAALSPAPAGAPRLRVLYTAMHGVGWEVASRVFAAAGFDTPQIVQEQVSPDPDFPTVAFPNPEEAGALDLAMATANRLDPAPQLIVVNDPDADRFSAAIPAPAASTGWRQLSGNEVGWLLGEHLAAAHEGEADASLACSLVSSPLLEQIAKAHGLRYEETLTGFKYVNRVPGLVFGYEEALGYLVDPQLVRDKDGISAALLFTGMAASLAARGLTVQDALDELAERYGTRASAQVAVRFADRSPLAALTEGLREHPLDEMAGLSVVRHDDLAHGGTLPPADILRYWLEDGSRVIVRPSGTEPKLKVYLDVVAADGSPEERRAEAQRRLDALRADWTKRLG